ncbi:RNA ligase (ATP) [Leifsonia sp. Leaf264]|uniref:RNA ligase (ATP) n=1 Tax=Leifsonia sp. Leaf264 TaxID=1736314 RepID=UPI0006F64D86|nr:RNA ligase (ATP) [Leifsonia sp. Leaf264]KQO98122.1 hypothetical protein ASF30_08480 [Leifsonia sp. Leaf264]
MTITLEAPAEIRSLATVETITEIHPIPDADAIVRARVRGWDVVVKKGEFVVGDLAVYFEVDSHLDTTDPRYEFLAPRGIRTNEDGFTGHVLKTAKLRGQYSQGLVLPINLFPELAGRQPGDNVTDELGVVKWDQPIPEDIKHIVVGGFPAGIPRTGEERLQNFGDLLRDGRDANWVATEKIDGTSMTVLTDGDYCGVAFRNYELKFDENNIMWKVAAKLNLHEQIAAAYPGARAAVQGELFGPGSGATSNPLQVTEATFAAFTVIVDGVEIPRDEWPEFVQAIAVPIHPLPFPETVDEALAQVDKLKSLVNPTRNAEGLVWRATDKTLIQVNERFVRASAKVVSNAYLMKADR